MDEFMQQIHELKQSLALEKANQEYMTAELESIHTTHDQQKAELTRKHSQEVEKYRQQIEELKNSQQSLEDDLQAQISALRQQNEALKVPPEPPAATLDLSITNLHLDQIQELSTQLQETQQQLAQLTDSHETMQQQLQENIACLEETLQSKRDQLEELEQTLEQYQDTIQELRSELMQLQTEPDATDCSKKGNSLFAEVIDQRQQVVQLLGAQNRSFKEMKRAYRQSETEIRQLKEENSLMVREMGKIKTIFLSANKTHTTQLNRRIQELHRDMDKLKQHSRFLEGQVQDGKLEAVMQFYINEGQSIRQELSHCRMQKCEMEDQLRLAQEELALWRFQCLKQKCVLIDREIKLEANNIPFESRCAVLVDETVHVAAADDVLMEDKRPCEVAALPTDVKEDEAEDSTHPLTAVVVKQEAVEPGAEAQEPFLDDDCEIIETPSNHATEEIDLSVDVEGVSLELQLDHSAMATRKEGDVQRFEELLTTSVAKESPAKARDCLLDLDFLLDSPDKANCMQRPPVLSPVVDLCASPAPPLAARKDDRAEEVGKQRVDCTENKENEEQMPQKKKSSITKLNYKAISNNQGAKSILVKRTGITENPQKNVQFATDATGLREVEQAKDVQRVGGGLGAAGATVEGVFMKQEPGLGQPKKAFKVNIRRIHSKPTPPSTQESTDGN